MQANGFGKGGRHRKLFIGGSRHFGGNSNPQTLGTKTPVKLTETDTEIKSKFISTTVCDMAVVKLRLTYRTRKSSAGAAPVSEEKCLIYEYPDGS